MINDFISAFSDLINYIKKQKRYITSEKTKKKLQDFYKKDWLPISNDFQKKFNIDLTYNLIENVLHELYDYSKRKTLRKDFILDELKKIEGGLDNIEIGLIRKYGTVIEYNKKKQIIDELTKHNFKGTLSYLRKSEEDFNKGEWKNCCSNSRLGLEEFLREFREKVMNKKILRGTGGDHLKAIKSKVGITEGETKLIHLGFYGFLSEKEGHATTDIPDKEDSATAIYVLYISINYLIQKYNSFFIL